MTTIKSFTDLSQSKTLSKILPIESADMSYSFNFDSGIYEISTTPYKSWVVPKYAQPDDGFGQVIPCWSLAALLGALPSSTLDSSNDHYYMLHCMGQITGRHENPIDTCYEMIVGLHGLKML